MDEVESIIRILLNSTYDKDDVTEAFNKADKFNAGAVDKPLGKHIKAVFDRLEDKDLLEDPERLKAWKTILTE